MYPVYTSLSETGATQEDAVRAPAATSQSTHTFPNKIQHGEAEGGVECGVTDHVCFVIVGSSYLMLSFSFSSSNVCLFPVMQAACSPFSVTAFFEK